MHIDSHQIRDDAGEALPFVESPNVGGALDPGYVVIHYTAGSGADASIRWLTRERARASAHVVVSRDGSVTQLVPLDRVAWHAGASRWEGVEGLNRHSIGIELDNAGRLHREGERWCAWFGTEIPDDEVVVATHKHEDEPCGWHAYTREQIEATLEIASALVQAYEIADIVGHDDIAPERKRDPGPAFPMQSFRARILGRSEDHLPVYETTTHLNIRSGPGTEHEKLPTSPLADGSRLHVLQKAGAWRMVKVVDDVAGEEDVEGWVHGHYIRRTG